MMDLATMEAMANEAAERARDEGAEPRVFTVSDADERFFRTFVREVPFLGDYVPEGWERVNLWAHEGARSRAGKVVSYVGDLDVGALFVDSSGMGADDEPALTLAQFRETLEIIGPGIGWGIVQAGQFQVKLGAYRKV